MALSEIIINDLVQYQTNAAINESNYQMLRQYLLKRKPLLTVATAIDSILTEQYNTDKQTIIHHLTQLACEAQKISDIEESRRDEQEKDNDGLLRSNYSHELSSIENKLPQLDTQIFQQQNYKSQIENQLSEYRINLSQVDLSIERIRSERNAINSRYLLNVVYPQTHVHTHSHVHTHYRNGTHFPHLHTVPNVIYNLQDQLTWDSLLREENRLIDERQRITRLIDAKSPEFIREQENLSRLRGEKKQAEDRLNVLKRQLDVELPNKEQQRYTKNQERIARDSARAMDDDSELHQLTHSNREVLKQQIMTKIEELDKLRDQLLKKAVDSSYPMYLSQLEDTLQGTTDPKLNHHEREALKSVLTMVKNLLEMEVQEQKIIRSLDEAKNKLIVQQKILSDCTSKLDTHETSNPQLKLVNKELGDQNIKLKLASESAGTIRNTALYSSLFAGGSSLISAAIIGSLIVSPLFFVISGALALAAVIALTVAVIYHFQKSASDDLLDQNIKTIQKNESIISKHGEEADELLETTIPGLKNKIMELEQTINQIDNQLKQHQNGMKQQVSKAQNVTEIYSASNSFFSSPADNVIPLTSAETPEHEHNRTFTQ